MKATCPGCKREYTPELAERPDFPEKYKSWKEKLHLIQDVWPDATPAAREQLITGICSDECWDNMCGVGI